MSQSAGAIDGNVLEIRSIPDMRVRLICWLAGALALIVVGVSGMVAGRTGYPFADQIEAFRVLTDYHGVLREEYLLEPRQKTLEE